MGKSRGQQRAAKEKKRRASKKAPVRGNVARPRREEALAPERARELGYDANAEPDREAWHQTSEQDRLSRVAHFHYETLQKAQLPPSMQRHAAMHVIVETQLVDDTPSQARAALVRLIDEGMSRHEALHAIGWVATEHMRRAIETHQPVDAQAYADDLATLTVRSWLKMAGLL